MECQCYKGYPFALWRHNGYGWEFVKGVSTDKIAYCSRYEKVISFGVDPNLFSKEPNW